MAERRDAAELPYRTARSGQEHMRSYTTRSTARTSQSSHHQGAVIAKLEDIFESIADQMLAEKPFVIPMKSRLNNEQALDAESGVLLNTGQSEVVNITWPGATQRESWKFGEIPMASNLLES